MNATMDESQSHRDLALIAGDDERAAREAFERLCNLTRQATLRQLLGRGVIAADAEDLTQDVYARLWRYRRNLQARTVAAWYALTRKTASRVLADHFGRPDRMDQDELPEEIPAVDQPYLEELVEAILNSDVLIQTAEDAWLGKCQSERDRDFGVSAVQLILFENLSIEDVSDLYAASADEVRRWLADPAVVGRALFAGLCWPNDELARYVLRPNAPLSVDELDAVATARTDFPPDLSWRGLEAQIVLWRVRNGLSEEQILRQTGPRFEDSELKRLVAALAKTYPYASQTRRLKTSSEPVALRQSIASHGLWKRIAFEYRTIRKLPHLQVLERAADAAREGGYQLDRTKLNNWFGLGRLYSELAALLSEFRSGS